MSISIASEAVNDAFNIHHSFLQFFIAMSWKTISLFQWFL